MTSSQFLEKICIQLDFTIHSKKNVLIHIIHTYRNKKKHENYIINIKEINATNNIIYYRGMFLPSAYFIKIFLFAYVVKSFQIMRH